MSRLINAQVEFHKLSPAEAPVLEDMVLALYREDPCGEPMSPSKIRRTIEELDRHPDKGRITLFRLGGEPVGYAITVYLWSNEFGGDVAVLDELYVKPSWRGRGIATRFLSHMAHTRTPALKGIRLEVTPGNDRALGFYRREGFIAASNHHLFKPLH